MRSPLDATIAKGAKVRIGPEKVRGVGLTPDGSGSLRITPDRSGSWGDDIGMTVRIGPDLSGATCDDGAWRDHGTMGLSGALAARVGRSWSQEKSHAERP